MEFFIITGQQAVGKMAVGKALCQKLDLKLFHNHMTIEMVIQLFDYKSPEAQRLIKTMRQLIFEEMAKSHGKGMAFTFLWDFDRPNDHDYIQGLIDLFEGEGAQVYVVELLADLDVRLERNTSPLRLKEKPSKRNLKWSQDEILNSMKKHRLVSHEGEIKHKHYLRLCNNDLTVDQAADRIVEHFSLNKTCQ